jgi:hypothetical protein
MKKGIKNAIKQKKKKKKNENLKNCEIAIEGKNNLQLKE